MDVWRNGDRDSVTLPTNPLQIYSEGVDQTITLNGPHR